MTNSPFEPPQNPSEENNDRRRRGASPLEFDEWVALLIAFGVLGSIFWWSLRPRAGEAEGWLGKWGGSSTGLLQGGAADSLKTGGQGLAGGLGRGDDDAGFLALRPQKDGDRDPIKTSDIDSSRPGLIGPQIPGAGFAAAGAAAGLATGAAATAPAAEAPAATTPEATAPASPAAPAATETETPAATESPIAVATEAPETSVPEVPADSWLYPFAQSLQASDRLGELPTTDTFDIDAPVTRAEFAALVSQAEQVEGDAAQAASKFEDIGAEFWAAPRISGALETGFMSGYGTLPDGRQLFGPAEEIPRYQALVAIASGLSLPAPANVDEILGQYDTTGMPTWAREKVAAALDAGLVINPTDQTKLDPMRPTTRGEATAMLQQVLQQEGKVEAVESGVTVNPK